MELRFDSYRLIAALRIVLGIEEHRLLDVSSSARNANGRPVQNVFNKQRSNASIAIHSEMIIDQPMAFG
jgi:hypothetical protein